MSNCNCYTGSVDEIILHIKKTLQENGIDSKINLTQINTADIPKFQKIFPHHTFTFINDDPEYPFPYHEMRLNDMK